MRSVTTMVASRRHMRERRAERMQRELEWTNQGAEVESAASRGTTHDAKGIAGHRTSGIDRPIMPAARRDAPTTSVMAAASMLGPARGQRRTVYETIRSYGEGGCADHEGEARSGIRPQSWTPRRGELARDGLIERTGERRATPSGRPADVWRVVEGAA